MDGRKLLTDKNNIRILIDSTTFMDLFKKGDRLDEALLIQQYSQYCEFVRTPSDVNNEILKKIPSYQYILDDTNEIHSLDIQFAEKNVKNRFGYKRNDIQKIAEIIYKKKEVTNEEIENLMIVFVQAIFNRKSKDNICITNNKTLLKNRLWMENHFPGGQLNIMSVKEASQFLDLFYKSKNKFQLSPQCTLNKGFYYWLSTRSKLPHYNTGDKYIDALATRFIYSLMAVDEIGIQYYSGVDNDTMDMQLYHFNFLISLITGIFDNLALKTHLLLNLNNIELNRISLNNNSGKIFLREIKEKRPDIRQLINKNVNFINAVYKFRELVIHREGVVKTGFSYKSHEEKWHANFIEIDTKIASELKHCGDNNEEFEVITRWGIYLFDKKCFLEPFHFSSEAIRLLSEFVDEYLKLLGYPLFIDQINSNQGDFQKHLELYEKYHLDF